LNAGTEMQLKSTKCSSCGRNAQNEISVKPNCPFLSLLILLQLINLALILMQFARLSQMPINQHGNRIAIIPNAIHNSYLLSGSGWLQRMYTI